MTTTPTRSKRQPIPFKPETRVVQFQLTETRIHTFDVSVQSDIKAEAVLQALEGEIESATDSVEIRAILKEAGIESDSTEIEIVDVDNVELEVEDDIVTDETTTFVIRRELEDGNIEFFGNNGENGSIVTSNQIRDAKLYLSFPTAEVLALNIFAKGSNKWSVQAISNDD